MGRWSGEDGGLWRLRALFVLSGAGGAALMPFFAPLLQGRGMDPEQIGLVLGATSLAGAIATPLWSHLADTRLGAVRVLQLSALTTVVGALALALAGSALLPVLITAALMSTCSAPKSPLSDALAVGYLGAERMTEYGRIRLWTSAGWGVAAIVFGVLFQHLGLGPALPFYALGVGLFGLWTLRLPAGAPLPMPARSRLGAVGDVVRASPRLLPFLAGVFLVSVAGSAAWAFVGLRILGQGGGPFLVGLAAGLTAFVEIPVMYSSAPLGRRFGQRAIYVTGALVYAAVFLAWTFVRGPLTITLVASADGVAFALAYTGVVVIVGKLVPARLASTGQALAWVVAGNMAPIFGGALGGVVFARLGAPALFAGSAALCVVGAAVVWIVLSGTEHSQGG